MRHYQSVLILKPDLDEAQVDQSVEKITEFIKKFEGEVLKLEKWGKKRLAYKVKKNKFGYYLNIYHSCAPSLMAEFEKELQLYDVVIKYLMIKMEEKDLERVRNKMAETAAEELAVAEAEAGKEAEAEKEAEAGKEADK